MTPEQFVYWLNGFAELNPSMEQPTAEQWKSITEHLKTVFVKVTPEVRMQINPNGQNAEQVAEKIMQIARREIDSFPRLGKPEYFGGIPVITC